MMNLQLRFIVLLATLMLIPLGGWAASSIYQLRVDGMPCPFCGYGIEKKLKSMKGVEKVDIDISKGVVTVTTSEGTTLTEQAMRKVVKDAGFTISGFKKVENPDAKTPKDEKAGQDN